MNIETIYMDQASYEAHLAQIDSVKQEINKLGELRKRCFSTEHDNWNSPEAADIDRQERVLLANLQDLLNKIPRIQIIESHNENNLIDINDIVRLEYCFGEGETEEEVIRLVGGLTEQIAGVYNVTINSPLGSAIYRKGEGETVSYQVEGNHISATIKEIMKQETLGTR